ELSRVGMKQVLLHAPLFWTYVELTALYTVPVTWCLFAEHLLGPGPLQIFRRVWQVFGAFTVTVHVLALTTGMSLYRPLDVFIYGFMLIVAPVLAAVTYLAWKGNADARALITGATVSAFAAIHEMLRSLGILPHDPEVNHLGMCFLVL